MDTTTKNKQKYDVAVQGLVPAIEKSGFVIEVRAYEVQVWSGSESIYFFPSNVDDLAIGIGVRSWDRTGGVAAESVIALGAGLDVALAVYEGWVADKRHQPDRVPVDARSVQVGDLIADLGFTVEKVRTIRTAGRGLVTILVDGERELPVITGYEFLVLRGWDGHRDFLDYPDTREKVRQSIVDRMSTDVEYDAESLLKWADEYYIDLRSTDLTDDQFGEIVTRAQAQEREQAELQRRVQRGMSALQEFVEHHRLDG